MRILVAGLVASAALFAAGGKVSVGEFQNPPDEFRPMPFWGWTGDINREQIQRQLRLMKEQKLTNVMLYPRYGLEVPYFSDEYLGLVRYAVEQARGLGLKIWLYDEYTWPSGTAGKRIPREFPQYQACSLRVFQRYVAARDARRRVELRLPENVVKAVAVAPDGRKVDVPVNGDALAWTAPAGAWRVMVFWAHRSERYVDTLDRAAARKFIDLTYEGYRKAVGEWFGSVVVGVFGDEPVMFFDVSPEKYGEFDVQSFPWTARMREEFRSDHGYDIADRLPELLAGGAVRRDLWATATRLYANSFHRQIAEWCGRHRIVYTSHLLSEEPASALVRAEGDYFASQRWMQVPSIDEIWTKAGFGGDYPNRKMATDFSGMPAHNKIAGEWVAPKMAQSTAEWMERGRTIVEVYALGPPSITLNEMRRMVNWEGVLGLNTFLLAVFPSSLRGATISTGYLPALFYQQPWFKYYSHYSDYVARTAYLLTRGERVSRTAVVYPSASAWGNPDLGKDLNGPLRELTQKLLQSHQDFTFVFESGLDRARGRKFDALYVPPLAALEPELARYVTEFAGPVYFYGRRPSGIAKGEVIGKDRFPMPPAAGAAVRIASPQDAGRILVQQRKAGNTAIYFFMNVSTEPTTAAVEIQGGGKAEFWDATTGKIAPAGNPVQRVFEPGEGVFVVVSPGTTVAVPSAPVLRAAEIRGPWEFRTERENPLRLRNWKALDGRRWESVVDVEYLPAKLELSLSQDLVERVWVNGKPLDWANSGSRYVDDHNREIDVTALLRRGRNTVAIEAVYGREFPFLAYGYLLGDFAVQDGRVVAPVREMPGAWTAAGYPLYAGTGIYSKTIEGREGHAELEIECVAMDAVEVLVNGKPAGVRLWEPYRFDLTGLLRPGANRLEIRVTNALGNLLAGPLPAGLTGPVRLLTEVKK